MGSLRRSSVVREIWKDGSIVALGTWLLDRFGEPTCGFWPVRTQCNSEVSHFSWCDQYACMKPPCTVCSPCTLAKSNAFFASSFSLLLTATRCSSGILVDKVSPSDLQRMSFVKQFRELQGVDTTKASKLPQPRTRAAYNALRSKIRVPGPEVSSVALIPEQGQERSTPAQQRSPPSSEIPPAVVSDLPFSQRYVLEGVLGKGSFGTVYRAQDKATGSVVAVKELCLPKKSREARNEAAMLQKLQGSRAVVEFYGLYDDCGEDEPNKKTSCIVMGLCSGGDLEDFVQKNGPMDDVQLRAVAVEVVRLVCDCHAAGIMHSDIKASNLMITSLASRDLLKTNPSLLQPGWLVGSDFGTARVAGLGYSSNALGTPSHWAPEVFGRKFNRAADIWSVGTMLSYLRYGRMPFWDASQEGKFRSTSELLRMLLLNPPSWSKDDSGDARLHDFLQGMLAKDPSHRLTAAEASVHPWLVTE